MPTTDLMTLLKKKLFVHANLQNPSIDIDDRNGRGTIEFLGSHWPWSWQICNCEYNIFAANSYLMSQHEYFCIVLNGGASFKFACFSFYTKFCKVYCIFLRSELRTHEKQLSDDDSPILLSKKVKFKFYYWQSLLWCECLFFFSCEQKNFLILNLLSFIGEWRQSIRVYTSKYKT